MKILKRITHILSIFCYIFVIIYGLVCLPILFGHNPLVVLTGSMEPTIKTGSILYYTKVNQSSINKGDVISFKIGNKVVSHRIYDVTNNGYVTKGDANNGVDARVISYSNILGKVDNITIPYLGYFVKTINSNMWIVLIIAGILLIEFILSNIPDKVKEVEIDDIEII